MIAYQIQALREKIGLNQTRFAQKIGKTQSVVSRLEDTEYGRVTVQTLLDIACSLDVALIVKFISYPDLLRQTSDMSVRALQPETIYETLSKPSPQIEGASAKARALLMPEQNVARNAAFASRNDNIPLLRLGSQNADVGQRKMQLAL